MITNLSIKNCAEINKTLSVMSTVLADSGWRGNTGVSRWMANSFQFGQSPLDYQHSWISVSSHVIFMLTIGEDTPTESHSTFVLFFFAAIHVLRLFYNFQPIFILVNWWTWMNGFNWNINICYYVFVQTLSSNGVSLHSLLMWSSDVTPGRTSDYLLKKQPAFVKW